MYCPRCGAAMTDVGGTLTCVPGAMSLSASLQETLEARFPAHRPRDGDPAPPFSLGWFCPGCGVPTSEDMTCRQCGGSIGDLMFALVDRHPHRLVGPPSAADRVEWPGDWRPFDAPRFEPAILAELEAETGDANPGHPLHGRACRVLGWRLRPRLRDDLASGAFAPPGPRLPWCKNLVLRLPDEGRFASVHLTWARETEPRWTWCDVFEDYRALNDFLRGA